MFELEGQDKCEAVTAPTVLPFFTAAVSGLFSVITIPCNVLVCFTIVKSPAQFKSIRTPFTYFILNLAVTDLLVGAITEPTSVVYHIMEAYAVSSPVLIRLLQVLYFLLCTVSVLSILALTVERCFAISKPFDYRRGVKLSRVLMASGIIWLLSPVFVAPYFTMGYRTFSFVFANVVIILIFCTLYAYFKIIKAIQHRKKFRKESLQGLCRANQKLALFEEKLTSTFISILILFAVCYVTPCLLMYVMNLCIPCSCDVIHWLRDTAFLTVTFNSAINPFLYAWRLPSFRRALKAVMTGSKNNSATTENSQPELGYILKRTSHSLI